MGKTCLWGLAASLLLVVATLLVVSASASFAQIPAGVPCQEVTGLYVGYEAPSVHPGQVVTFTGQIVSGTLPVTYTWDWGDGGSTTPTTAMQAEWTGAHSYTTTGLFSVTLAAWNPCTVEPVTATTRVTVTAWPCITVTDLFWTYEPTDVHAYEPVFLNAQVLTGSMPVTYTWDWGDGSPPAEGVLALPAFTATHTFTRAQELTVTLAAWNACTLTPTTQAHSLVIAPCQVVTGAQIVQFPEVVQAGQVVTLSAVLSGGSGPLSYAWDLGDGTTGSGPMVTHAYPIVWEDASYTVILTASNPCGSEVISKPISVLALRRHTYLPYVGKVISPPGPAAHLGYGANVASADHATYLAEMGFDWAKGFATWQAAPPYDWVNVDNQLREFLASVSNVLIRVGGDDQHKPPLTPAERTAFRAYVQALAHHVSTTWRPQGLKTAAYEIWNEPNLEYEWGEAPNAAQYTALLKEAYQGVKTGDPQAYVVSAGLATTGGTLQDSAAEQAAVVAFAQSLYGVEAVVPDLTFLQQMYLNGAKGHLDALGTHPYGGADPPEVAPALATGPIYFRRAEEQRQVMLDNGDQSPMWNTEFGWVVETSYNLGEHEWMEVTEAQQAQYLADAYAYADEHWPWMGPMFFFNLDFGTVDWYKVEDPMRWYSITYRVDPKTNSTSPILLRPAYYSLKAMPKNSAW